MLPLHTRVVAIDDNEDHLKKITWGLGKAGFSPLPFQFNDGKLEDAPENPIPGIRLVFSDIHIAPAAQNNNVVNATNIVRCLKKLVGEGPYALIFWSQFPGDVEHIRPLIEERAAEQKLTVPLVFGRIDKNEVFKLDAQPIADDFDANKLRELILAEVKDFKTLAAAVSWDNRVAAAAAKTTNQLFKLAGDSAERSALWNQLLAYLACESTGHHRAKVLPREALDSALLPLLEDQLALIGREPDDTSNAMSELAEILNASRPKLPNAIKPEMLNSSYLIEERSGDYQYKMQDRGVVTKLGGAFVNSGEFVRAFGSDDEAIIRSEFSTHKFNAEERSKLKLHIVEVGPECDHVQGKISTHKYLLALLVPLSLFDKCAEIKKKTHEIQKYRNLSIWDSGPLRLSGKDEAHRLLISCRCFMALAPEKNIDGEPQFRLRKDLLNEVLHHYTTHARRPGVMRF